MNICLTFAFVLISLSALTSGQVYFEEQCPEPPTQQNFNATRYLGRWYEQKKFFFIFEQGICVTADYGATNQVNKISVKNTMVTPLFKVPISIQGYATKADNSNDGKLKVKFNLIPFSAPYWVLETDYVNYSVVFACQPSGLGSLQFAWILTRQPQPDESIIRKAEEVLTRNKIDVAKLQTTKQSNCSYQ